MTKKLPETDEEWQKTLTRDQYSVCRKRGTEAPFSGKYNDCSDEGVYKCVCCGESLFRSETKFDAGCGWPSFWEPVENKQVAEHSDLSHGMSRTEVTCSNCDAHLGHVFNDGPAPSNLRYCINSVALDFDEGQESNQG